MPRIALQRFLDRLELRSSLTPDQRQAVLALSYTRLVVDNHRDVVVPGRAVDHALLVGSGWAGRFDQLADGQRESVAIYMSGDMCDLHSVVAPLPGWGIQALGTTEFFKIPHVELRQLVADSPALANAFWRDSVVDASILAKWVCNRGRRQSAGRLAHLLCEIGLRSEQAGMGDRNRFELRVTQLQLSEMLGITAVHTNRTMQGLRQAGLVTTCGVMISIPDWDRLADTGEFDPAYLLLANASNPPPRRGHADRPAAAVC